MPKDRTTPRRDDTRIAGLLAALGERVRMARARRGMTRRTLAGDSGVSERYLAQLETGHGNPSIAVLARIAEAMGCPIGDLVAGDRPRSDMAGAEPSSKAHRIALIGLRGAGKSTLGTRLAAHLGVPFIELDRRIEQEYGADIGALLALSGQPAFRRYERRCLDRVISDHSRAVIATGGGIVADTATYDHLLAHAQTIWLQAAPEDHMRRVRAQGDLRPMARNPEAMADLQAILAARESQYGRSDARLDTSADNPAGSLAKLIRIADDLLTARPLTSAA